MTWLQAGAKSLYVCRIAAARHHFRSRRAAAAKPPQSLGKRTPTTLFFGRDFPAGRDFHLPRNGSKDAA